MRAPTHAQGQHGTGTTFGIAKRVKAGEDLRAAPSCRRLKVSQDLVPNANLLGARVELSFAPDRETVPGQD